MNDLDPNENPPCLLCGSEESGFFFEDKFRPYFRCAVCSLIYVPEQYHVSEKSEKARYEEHNNDPDDPRYRQFLERIAPPVIRRFPAGAHGLDFGSGPTPLLAAILRESGFEMEVFDPIYENNNSVLDDVYDFVVATEVVEHLKRPLFELRKLFSIIKSDGMLAAMTRPFDNTIDFNGWHYKNDRTHIAFFSVETFDWISDYFGFGYTCPEPDIFIFDKRNTL